MLSQCADICLYFVASCDIWCWYFPSARVFSVSLINFRLSLCYGRVNKLSMIRITFGHVSFLGSTSGAATLSISPRKVRQIHDPIQQILNVLHKVIYITQLPPSLSHNPRRTVIDKFKRSLFSPSTNSLNLKAELNKLAGGSPDLIDISWGNMDLAGKRAASSPTRSHNPASNNGITHESKELTHTRIYCTGSSGIS